MQRVEHAPCVGVNALRQPGHEIGHPFFIFSQRPGIGAGEMQEAGDLPGNPLDFLHKPACRVKNSIRKAVDEITPPLHSFAGQRGDELDCGIDSILHGLPDVPGEFPDGGNEVREKLPDGIHDFLHFRHKRIERAGNRLRKKRHNGVYKRRYYIFNGFKGRVHGVSEILACRIGCDERGYQTGNQRNYKHDRVGIHHNV